MVIQQQSTVRQLAELIGPVCVDAGYELIEVEYKISGSAGPLLRVYIDYAMEANQAVTCDDCVKLSHELSAVLDVEDLITTAYCLEVSSPGVERPLRKPEHFRRFVGEEVKLTLSKGLDGRRNFTGQLSSVSESGTTVTLAVDGKQFELPLADLASAKLVPDWNALMKAQGNKA